MLVACATLALATAACSSTDDRSAAGASSISAPTAGPSPSPIGGALTTAPTEVNATGGSTAAATATVGQVCPVTVETLLAAMRADKNGGSRLAEGATLGKPECNDGYVLIPQTSIKDANGRPVADDEVAIFKYGSDGWRYQGSHSTDYCYGMPAATAKYFRSHFSGGCGGS
ncbi:hypothetical protein Areg01_60490 [Actinoplanes regularis]|nr:hypothetical protein Areg01_60490 [Actinoplanes regularis]